MTSAAASTDKRPTAILVAGVALLAISIASILTISFERDEGVTLLLAYVGGTAMLLTP